MKILILGGDGYLGWPTAMYLSNRGYEVLIVDDYSRKKIARIMTELSLRKKLEKFLINQT